MDEVDGFNCFGSCISPDCRIWDGAGSRTQKTRFAFGNLRYLWCQCDGRLSISSKVGTAFTAQKHVR